jgi:Putative Ig domain
MEFTMPTSLNKILLPVINQFNQNYFNKIFWKIHYLQIIEELKQDLINQSRGAIAQRLFELRDIIGKYSLSPASYQAGIEELQKYVKQQPELAARYFPFLSDCINQFQAALIKQPAFVLENFMADIFYALTQRHESKTTLLEIAQSLGFYKNLLVSTCYADTLRLFINFYQADLLIASDNDSHALAALDEEFIKRLCDTFANAQTRLPPQISPVIAAQPRIPDTETSALSNSYRKFTKALQQATSSLVQNPIAALTTALAYQIAAATGLSTMPFTKQNQEQDRDITLSNSALTQYSPSANSAKELLEHRFIEVAHKLEHNKLKSHAKSLTWINRSSLESNQLDSSQAFRITRLANNNFLVLWKNINQDGSTFNVAGKLFMGNSTLITTFQLPTQSDDPLPNCYAVELLNNDFAVAWSCINSTDSNQELLQGQRFTADGSAIDAPFQIQVVTGDTLTYPVLETLENGSFVAVWQQDSGPLPNDSHRLWARMYNTTAMPLNNAFAISPTSSANQLTPAVTSTSSGGFFVAWTVPGQKITQPSRLYGQFFSQSGEPLQNAFPVVPQGNDYQSQPACNQLGNDRILIAWQSSQQSDTNSQIYAQLIDMQGNILRAAFPVSYSTQNSQEAAVIANLSSGNCLISWITTMPNTTTISLTALILDTNGNTVGNEINIQAVDNDVPVLPSINSLDNGDFVLTSPIGDPTQDFAVSILSTQLSATNLNQILDYTEDQVCPFVPITIDAPIFTSEISVSMMLSEPNVGNIYSNATTEEVSFNVQNESWQITGPVSEVNHALASLQFDPAPHFYNNFNITVVITDNFNQSLTGAIKVIGNRIHHALILNHPIANQILEANQPFSFTFAADTFIDVDGDPLTYTAQQANNEPLPDWLVFTPDTHTLKGTPSEQDVGNLTLGITATDSLQGDNVTALFGMQINPAHNPDYTAENNRSNFTPLIAAGAAGVGGAVLALAGWLGYRYRKQRRARDANITAGEGTTANQPGEPPTNIEMEVIEGDRHQDESDELDEPKNEQTDLQDRPLQLKREPSRRTVSVPSADNRGPYNILTSQNFHSREKEGLLVEEEGDDPEHGNTPEGTSFTS